jgi:hypothetical protein
VPVETVGAAALAKAGAVSAFAPEDGKAGSFFARAASDLRFQLQPELPLRQPVMASVAATTTIAGQHFARMAENSLIDEREKGSQDVPPFAASLPRGVRAVLFPEDVTYSNRVRTTANWFRDNATGRHWTYCIASEFDGRKRHAKWCGIFRRTQRMNVDASSPTQGGDYRKPHIAVNANRTPELHRTRRPRAHKHKKPATHVRVSRAFESSVCQQKALPAFL